MDATLLLLGYCYRINDDIELGIIVNPRVATHPKVDYHHYILSIRLSGLTKSNIFKCAGAQLCKYERGAQVY